MGADGEERALSHLVLFIAAFLLFLFCVFVCLFVFGSGFVLLVPCNMKRDEGRRDGEAVEGCGGSQRRSHMHHCHLLGKDLISPVLDQFD